MQMNQGGTQDQQTEIYSQDNLWYYQTDTGQKIGCVYAICFLDDPAFEDRQIVPNRVPGLLVLCPDMRPDDRGRGDRPGCSR